jgi:PAS domain S-box-containing protein
MRRLFGKTVGRSGKLSAGLFVVAVALSIYGIWLLSADARRELDAMATANGDSLQWSLTQSEVEYFRLLNAVILAGPEDAQSLDQVRRRFDVFFSRMNIIDSARPFQMMLKQPDVLAATARIFIFLEEYVAVIDGGDSNLAAVLPAMREALYPLHSDIRSISLVGVRVFSASSERQRERVADALFDLAMLILFLGTVLLGVVFVLAHVLGIALRQTAEIEQAQRRLESIVGTSLDGVVVVDSESRIVEFNGAAEAIFGYERAEAIGRSMSELIIPKHLRRAHAKGMRRYLASGTTRMIDAGLVQLQAMRKDGSEFPVELSISTAQRDESEIFISFIRDISKRVASEMELVEARDHAVAGEKAKADLLAVMSHEMRTPLNGILGTLELLQTSGLNARQDHLARIMGRSGQMLLRHVNDVLDVSRMDAGASVAANEPFDPGALAQSVCEGLRSAAAAVGNRVEVRMLGPVPPLVIGDRDRLEQILVNLVGNAVKFTENGLISVEVEAEPGSDILELRVTDTGIGIAQDNQERIFGDFVTLDASYARSAAGTGLGLGIARRLVTILGGEIGVESDIGEGSVFWVRVPLPAAEETEVARSADAMSVQTDGRGKRVLLVEDNEINRLVAREMLSESGYEVTEACDGIEGVEKASKARFDFIAMDINMPRLDGVSAAKRILGSAGPNRQTPIIALTAHALPEDIRRFRAAGFADVLIKPLSRQSLAAVLSETLERAPVEPAEPAADTFESVLGSASAHRLRARAVLEIGDALDVLAKDMDDGGTVGDARDVLHRMVGLAGLVGLADVHAALIALETSVRQGDLSGVGEKIARIRETLSLAEDVS